MKRLTFGLLLCIIVSGCISQSYLIEDIILYWSSIKSFEAQEIIRISNQSFKSYVIFVKPDKIIRVDYVNGSLAQKIIFENNIQKIITSSGTFILNATMNDVNALDPFVAILNNLHNFNVTKNGNILILKPRTLEMPTYEVELNGKLPAKIIIKQTGQTITVEYKKLEIET